MKSRKITYNPLVVLKNTLLAVLFILLTMQSILTFLIAETIETKKETIALIVNDVTDKITNTHRKHVAIIEHKIDKTISLLKKYSNNSSQQDDSKNQRSSISFPIICQVIMPFEFIQKDPLPAKDFIFFNDKIHLLLWVIKQPHPPKA